MRKAVGIACIAALCGCHAVYVQEPIGERPRDISREAGEWAGTWCHADGALRVTASDTTNGVLTISWIEEANGAVTAKSARVYLRDFRDWTFATIRGAEPKEEEESVRMVWGRVSRRKRTALVWFPDVSEFKRLVEDGTLPGTVEKGDVLLAALTTNHLDRIACTRQGVLFDWENPLVLWKTSE